MIRCGKLAVEGEEEEVIAVLPRTSKPQQRHRKPSNNPYSSRGLDKFARLNDELSAKREHFASKTGTPEELVRFAHSSRGWVPVVFRNASHGGPGGVLILPPIKVKEHKGSKNGTDGDREMGMILEKGRLMGLQRRKRVSVIMLPWWSGYLEIAAFGVLLSVSIILARKSALRVAATAAVIVVGYLQIRLQGFVTLVSIFSKPLSAARGKKSSMGIVQASPENKVASEYGSQCKSASSSPTVFSKDSTSQEPNTQLENEKTYDEKNKFERIVSMEDRAAKKPIRLQEADIFLKRRKARNGTIDATAIASVMIIVLFFLIFYGRLPAICFTSAWWYVLPKFRTNGSSTPINGRVINYLQSRVYRNKIHS